MDSRKAAKTLEKHFAGFASLPEITVDQRLKILYHRTTTTVVEHIPEEEGSDHQVSVAWQMESHLSLPITYGTSTTNKEIFKWK